MKPSALLPGGLLLAAALVFSGSNQLSAQQTLGTLTGTVTDTTGAILPGTTVSVTGSNGINRTATSTNAGTYQLQNLPIGHYQVVFKHEGFTEARVPDVDVQQDRTGTINAQLKPGSADTTVEVTTQNVLNQTDATNGYVLESQQIQETPLATGSFTRLATLTPGVSGELQAGIGTNAGLGNQPLWANGQRDTSNGFQVNGVDVTNLFNGKSSSQDQSQRYNFNIGQGAATAGKSQTDTSVYGSNGQGLATPPPEFIQQISVNTSQYDASQGNRSGAQIDVNTVTGTDHYHGQIYGYRATNFANAAPFFNKQGYLYQKNLPESFLVPQLHRFTTGATVGGPIIKDKLFFFLGYQFTSDSDALKGLSTLAVPFGLTDDRSTAGITNAIASYQAVSAAQKATVPSFNGTFDPVALALLQAKLPSGGYLIPSAQSAAPADLTSGAATANNVSLTQPSLSQTNQADAALDYNLTAKDRLSLKYYYQHAPVTSPFTNSNTIGYPATEDSGAQVAALTNSITIGSRINWVQTMGFSRQKVYSTFKSAFGNNTFGTGFPGGTELPGITLSKFNYYNGGSVTAGPNSTFANAGYFQNRWAPTTVITFTLGKHNLSAGANYSYTQLNVRNRRNNLGSLTSANFVTFVEGQVSASNEIVGNTNRYYRANETGGFIQDQWRPIPNITLTVGVRYDNDGGFSEKYGNIFNFDPRLYSVTDTTVTNAGFVVAGNNKFDPTQGVNNTTLTGRQWGFGPRIGFAFTPLQNNSKVVFHGGVGMYYDRGEYFSYLSQPAGSSVGGPFGATEAPPLVNYVTGTGTRTLENPLGTAVIPASTSDPSTFNAKLVTASQIRAGCTGLAVETANSNSDCSVQPYNFGAYARDNKLPYTFSYSFNTQLQVDRDLSVTIGYLGNVGRHLVIPVPFNEPGIATPDNPIHGETSSYGYEVLNANSVTANGKYNPISTEPYSTYDGGNIDLRVPYIGYSPNAALFRAAGVSAYNALIAQATQRTGKYVSFQASYTFSHALDEQSDIGLFFTGDNPNKLRDSYASADFDRTHIFTLSYQFRVPDLKPASSLVGKFTNGWQITGLTTLQSGQPYSLYEYDGAVGSLYFGNYPTLANPIIGIKQGKNPNSAKTGHSGAFLNVNSTGGYSYIPAIDPTQLAVNYVAPGQKGVPACTGNEPCDIFENDFTPGQRNIFRQSFQKDADVSFQKITKFTERYTLRYDFDVYNITNSSSFDVPNNSASVSQSKLTSTAKGAPAVAYGQVATTQATQVADQTRLYVTPTLGATSFGAVRNTIGQPRTIEMSLHLLF
jgi:hypothetical protein